MTQLIRHPKWCHDHEWEIVEPLIPILGELVDLFFDIYKELPTKSFSYDMFGKELIDFFDKNFIDFFKKTICPAIEGCCEKGQGGKWRCGYISFTAKSGKNYEEFTEHPGLYIPIEHWWKDREMWLFDDYISINLEDMTIRFNSV